MGYDDIPDCCKKCSNFGDDYNEFTNETGYYCEKNIKFPTIKKSCKKQQSPRYLNNPDGDMTYTCPQGYHDDSDKDCSKCTTSEACEATDKECD